MASAADIAVNSSNYVGNAALGGGIIEAIKVDTTPIQQLAYYTMLYNRAEYEQAQKDAEKVAEEIADHTSYDLTSGIPKDAKILQEKYDKLIQFTRDNPDAVNYRNKEQWAKYKTMRNDLDNDIKSAKTRSLMAQARRTEITNETNPERRKILQEELDKEINETDIRTPLNHTQKYDLSVPEMPKGQAVQFDVFVEGLNKDYKRDFSLFDAKKARESANVFGLGLDSEIIDKSTPGGKQKDIARRGNFWIKGSEQFNAALADASLRNQDGSIDETKLKGVTKQLVDLITKANKYLEIKSSEIKSGVYKDKFGKPITFGNGMLREEDYAPINYQDGISADELAFLAQYASWAGDTYKTTQFETDDEIQRQQLAVSRFNAETGRLSATKSEGEATTFTEDEPERRVNDFVVSYNSSVTPTSNRVKSTSLDAYTVKSLQITGSQYVVIEGDVIKVYKNESDPSPVKTITLDGAKSVVSDILFPTRTGKEEKKKFGSQKQIKNTPASIEEKWKQRRVN
jgi:hypothetical protein